MEWSWSVLTVVLALGACGSLGQGGAVDDGDPPAEPETVDIRVDVYVYSGFIAPKIAGTQCALRDPEYVLRDGSGEILAMGNLESDHDEHVDIDWRHPAPGRLVGPEDHPMPCNVPVSLQAPESDFYELQITSQRSIDGLGGVEDTFTSEAAFSLVDVGSGPIEIQMHDPSD